MLCKKQPRGQIRLSAGLFSPFTRPAWSTARNAISAPSAAASRRLRSETLACGQVSVGICTDPKERIFFLSPHRMCHPAGTPFHFHARRK